MRFGLGKRHGKHHAAFFKALAEEVARIQHNTTASVAVVIHGCSGSYRDVAYLSGAVLAWIGLLLALYLPDELHPLWIPFELLGLFAVGAWFGSRSRLRVRLTTWRRRRRQVRTAAHAAYIEEGLWHACDDRGLLIYWSVLERRIEVVAGAGVLHAIPAEAWHQFLFHLRALPRRPHAAAALLERLRELDVLLTKHLPAEQSQALPLLPSGVAR